MSLKTGVRPPHLAEEDLLRWIDHQLDLEGSRRVRSHLATCEGCSARLEALRHRSREVSGWIAEIPVQLPDPSRRALALTAVERARTRRRMMAPGTGGALLRVAALVVLMVGLTLSTGAGRSWVGDRVQQAVGPDPGPLGAALLHVFGREPARLAAAPGGGVHESAAPPPAAPALAPRTLSQARQAKAPPRDPGPPPVAFEPQGPEVVLEFDNLQERGMAVLTIRDVPGATARITSGAAGEKLVATASGLQVRNQRRSRAEYTIVVPMRFRVVRVRVAKRQDMVIRVRPSKQEWLWSINLEDTALR
jgi:hypothetical protein